MLLLPKFTSEVTASNSKNNICNKIYNKMKALLFYVLFFITFLFVCCCFFLYLQPHHASYRFNYEILVINIKHLKSAIN